MEKVQAPDGPPIGKHPLTLSRGNVFKEAFGKKIVSTIEKDKVEKWLYSLYISEKTRQNYCIAVISSFKWCEIYMGNIKCLKFQKDYDFLETI